MQKQNCVCKHIRRSNLKIGILGVPFNKGQRKEGVKNGPNAIRNNKLIEQLKEIDSSADIKDFGDITYEVKEQHEIENMMEYDHVVSCNEQVSKNVSNIIKEGRICLTLGGDHSIGIGTVHGHLQAKNDEICVLWVDAHADINTYKTSPSGNIHGMPLALVVSELAEYWPPLPGMNWRKPSLSARNLAYIGLRSVDPYERLIIEKFGIAAFGMEDVETFGIDNVVKMALHRVDPESKLSIHVSYDIDSLDPLEAPSTGTPVRGGLSLREGMHIMEAISRTGRLGAMDLLEVNPTIGSEDDVKKTVDAAIYIITTAFGNSRRGLKAPTDCLPL